MEKKKKTQHLHYNNNWQALSSYKYMFYASYFFFLLVAFPCWCFTNTSLLPPPLPASILTVFIMLSVKNFFSMWKMRVSRVLKSSILNNFSAKCFVSGCVMISGRVLGSKNFEQLFFFFLYILFSLLSGRALMLWTTHNREKSCVLTRDCDLFSRNIFHFWHVWVKRCRDEICFSNAFDCCGV